MSGSEKQQDNHDIETSAQTEAQPEADAKPEANAQTADTDWKAYAQKWEKRAKGNLKRISELEAAVKAASESKDEAVRDALAPLKEQIAEFEKAQQINEWKSEVSKDLGIPAHILRGTCLEDIKTHGQQLAKLFAANPRGPVLADAGKAPNKDLNDTSRFLQRLFGNT